jgi:hypothetical protein
MNQKSLRTIALRSFVLVGVLGAAWQTHAQDSKTSYPSMAPLDQYLIGFVCMVQRSWAAGIDDPDFWNPKLRSPICLNAPAARSFLPLIIKRTELILAGRSKDQMFAAIQAAIDRKSCRRRSPARCAT